MKRIGIIAAMKEEMEQIKNIMSNISEKKIYNLLFYIGTISSRECVLVECGIGKVNAARTTQILIDNFEIEYVINIGTAGATSKKLNTTDVVIADRLIQYDFDITAFGHEKGYITGVGQYVNADSSLVKKCKEVMKNLDKKDNYKVHVGTIASGDTFCTDRNIADSLYINYNAICVEMEGAAIGQICTLDEVPFIVIRSISDSPNGNNNIEFDEYLKISSKRCATFLRDMLND